MTSSYYNPVCTVGEKPGRAVALERQFPGSEDFRVASKKVRCDFRLPSGSDDEKLAMEEAIRTTAPDPRFVPWSKDLIEDHIQRESEEKPNSASKQSSRDLTLPQGQLREGSSRQFLSRYNRCIYAIGSDGAATFGGYISASLCTESDIILLMEASDRAGFWESTRAVEERAPTDFDLISSDQPHHIFISHGFWNKQVFRSVHEFTDVALERLFRYFRGYRIAGVGWSQFVMYRALVQKIGILLGPFAYDIQKVSLNSAKEDAQICKQIQGCEFDLFLFRPKFRWYTGGADSPFYKPYYQVFEHLETPRRQIRLRKKASKSLYAMCARARIWHECKWDEREATSLLGWTDRSNSTRNKFFRFWEESLKDHMSSGTDRRAEALSAVFEESPDLLLPSSYVGDVQ